MLYLVSQFYMHEGFAHGTSPCPPPCYLGCCAPFRPTFKYLPERIWCQVEHRRKRPLIWKQLTVHITGRVHEQAGLNSFESVVLRIVAG